jgi:tRNA(Ile)-lysidine synthase
VFVWDAKTKHIIKDIGILSAEQKHGQGIHLKYRSASMKVAFRQGGEKCQPQGRQGRHSLKKLFQEYAVPPWLRDRIPLLMIDDQIAAVVGYFYCAPFAVNKDENGLIITLAVELD